MRHLIAIGCQLTVWLALLALLLAPVLGAAQTQLYRFRDAEGRLIVTDDPGRLPPSIRNDPRLQPDPAAFSGLSIVGSTPATAQPADEQPYQTTGAAQPSAFTAIRVLGNKVIVPVQARQGRRSQKLQLLLDTGASTSLLYATAAERLRLKGKQRVRGYQASGALLEARLAQLDQLQVGPHQLRQLPVAIVAQPDERLPFDGLLGMDVLRQLRYQIDFEQQQIRWHP